jgi:hypothetical protein
MLLARPLLILIAFVLFTCGANGAPGDIVCRYETTTLGEVNYYTCTELARKYSITVEKFFTLHPSVHKNCDTIKPNTNYCVAGYKLLTPVWHNMVNLFLNRTGLELPVADDGFCGPQHNNSTCLGLDNQCCNGETWKCGDQM